MKLFSRLLLVVVVLVAAPLFAAEEAPSPSVLAASIGDSVVVVEPISGMTMAFDTGPVGWLYPGPGGILFAPDVINGRTTVINLRSLLVVDRLDALSMPHFGKHPDRYVAITGDVVLASHPDRATIARITAQISNPWQVITAPDDAAVLILERLPDGSTGIHVTTANLITREIVYRRPLAGDIIHMDLSPQLGLLALADREGERVHLVEPASLTPMADRPIGGRPIDVAFVHEGKILATAFETADGGGLDLALFKSNKKGMKLHKEFTVALPAAPVRMAASPEGDRVAIGLVNNTISIISIGEKEIVATVELPGTPRDLRWCDLVRDGPMVPEWTDGEPAEVDFAPFVPKVRDDKSSGLEEPSWRKPPG